MLYLTYDNNKKTDGAGSQLQRIISIYMIAKYYNVGYIHTSLSKLDYQGLQCLEANTCEPLQLDMYNMYFNLDSDSPSNEIEFDETYESEITHDIIMQYKDTPKNILLKITAAHNMTDANPDIFNKAPKFDWVSNSLFTPLRIAIHVRRGELFVVDSHRMLPNSYYIDCMRSLKCILDTHNIPFEFHLYTEVVKEPIHITPSHHGISNRTTHTITIRPEDSHIEDFNCFDSIHYHINESPVDTLIDLINSDILLASRSSYSYVAAILKKKGLVLFHPFWHSLSNHWIPVYSANDIINNTERILSAIKLSK